MAREEDLTSIKKRLGGRYGGEPEKAIADPGNLEQPMKKKKSKLAEYFPELREVSGDTKRARDVPKGEVAKVMRKLFGARTGFLMDRTAYGSRMLKFDISDWVWSHQGFNNPAGYSYIEKDSAKKMNKLNDIIKKNNWPFQATYRALNNGEFQIILSTSRL